MSFNRQRRARAVRRRSSGARFAACCALSIAAMAMLADARPARRDAAPFLSWPPLTSESRPWTRWWWLGSSGDLSDFSQAMEQYAAAGLGGLEITPIYGVRGDERNFRPYLSPAWLDLLEHVLREGRRLDLGIDMATGTGWPFGGPWVEPAAACKTLIRREFSLRGGESLSEELTYRQPPLARGIGRRPDAPALREPLRANRDLQALALEQVRFPRTLPLVALAAQSAGGELVQLAERVDARGRLDWKAPPGAWMLYALYQGWHGKLVERAGPGGEGDVIDHFSRTALAAYLDRLGRSFRGRDLRGLRAYFNDSYEVDDAAGEANWTPDFWREFELRRGYDLRSRLPALFGRDSAEANARVLCDYRETLSDLLLAEFTTPWREWAVRRGALVRNQAHGSPANIQDLYAAVDIPETEGEDPLRLQAAASAAHVAGKKLVSAEAATWLDEHFTVTLGAVKGAVDRFLLAGVNHIVYHGTPFSPERDPWPGRLFYASTHFGPTNSFWRDFPALNRYVARCQSFLQQGSSDGDVLLYWPFHDRLSEPGRRSLQHFMGGEGDGFRAAATALKAAGFQFDAVSDRQVLGLSYAGEGIRTAGAAAYRAIVVPETHRMPLETLEKLAILAGEGAQILFHRSLPGDVPGLSQLAERRERLRSLLSTLGPPTAARNTVTPVGRGRVHVGADLHRLLAGAGLAGEPMAAQGLQFVRRRTGRGVVYFILNPGPATHEGPLRLAGPPRRTAHFDPARELARELNPVAARRGSGFSVDLRLAAGESAIVLVGTPAEREAPAAARLAAGVPYPVPGPWTVRFVAGGPALPPPSVRSALTSWTEFGEEARVFSGTARYTARFSLPATRAETWRLDLGRVAESAALRLNGQSLGTVLGPVYELPIPAGLLPPGRTHVLEVEVTNLMANRIAGMDRKGVTWKRFYNINFPARRRENAGTDGLFTAAGWEPRPSGLLGPVTLTPLAVR